MNLKANEFSVKKGDFMRTVIANAFSVNMLKQDSMLFFAQITLNIAMFMISDSSNIYSIVGHQSTADLLSAKLGCDIPLNRENYKKEKDDRIIVCLPDTRLKEGEVLSKEELSRINVKFWLIK